MATLRICVVSALHDVLTSGHTGELGNKPEERKRLIQAALKNANRDQTLEFVLIQKPEQNLSLAECAHDKAMLDFFESAWIEWTQLFRMYPNQITKDIFGGDTVPDDSTNKRKREDEEVKPPPFVCKFGSAPRHDGTQDVSTGSILSKIAYYSGL